MICCAGTCSTELPLCWQGVLKLVLSCVHASTCYEAHRGAELLDALTQLTSDLSEGTRQDTRATSWWRSNELYTPLNISSVATSSSAVSSCDERPTG
jgi:hypothetical protein